MMFRYGKIIESNNKTSRSDRFAEMSKQQQLIESKKQEIKAKFEERKRQEAEEALKKIGNKATSEQKSSRDHKSLINSRMQSWKKDGRWRKKTNNSDHIESSSNLFSNDGSFFEKYQKIPIVKSPENENVNTVEHTNTNEDNQVSEKIFQENNGQLLYNHNTENNILPHTNFDSNRKFGDFSEGILYPPPNINIHPVSSTIAIASQQPSLYTLTSHPPPVPPSSTSHTSLASVPLLPAVPSSGTSLQTVSLIQVPVSVPASSVILSCPLETTLVTSEPVVHLPVVHSTLSHNSISVPLQTVPLQTTVIPAQIQITSQTTVPQSSMQAMQINQSSTNVILSQTLQPQSILVSSECIQEPQRSGLPNTNVPPPMLPLPTQPPPILNSVFSTMPPHSQPSITSTCLPPVHLPPPNFNPVTPMDVHHQKQDMRAVLNYTHPNYKCSQFSKENDDFYSERSLITSESDMQHQKHSQKLQDDNHNKTDDLEEVESVARIVADCGDDTENLLLAKYPNDEKLWFLRDKQSPSYIAFRSMVERMQKKGGNRENKKKDQTQFNYEDDVISQEKKKDVHKLSRVPADDNDDSESEEIEIKRKRKRKSRWAPEDVKIEVPSVTSELSINSAMNITVNPPSQQKKITGVTGPVISQITRSDPALLQYALKAFGTVNLSEEDWKKAEDHYKINLLYQDMLKKRQELEKLQAAGKFKYAYDSDEDTKGGTWEHKLRQQEMIATQRWADELTERAKGKHHIGDFLPPDELERFMEKYNALKQGREPDLSDYKEFKLKEDNIGFQILQKLGWSEGQGLGSDGTGIINPVNKAPSYAVSHGLGIEKPDDVTGDDDEYDAYRKRMMLAYRFRPNPLNNPRRPYY